MSDIINLINRSREAVSEAAEILKLMQLQLDAEKQKTEMLSTKLKEVEGELEQRVNNVVELCAELTILKSQPRPDRNRPNHSRTATYHPYHPRRPLRRK